MEPLTCYPGMADPDIDLTAIVLRERSRLGNFIRRRVRDQIDAEHILQDVLFAFVEAFRLPPSIEHASGWLFQVVRNRIIDRFRRENEELIPDTASEDDELESGVSVNTLLARKRYAITFLRRRLRAAYDEIDI